MSMVRDLSKGYANFFIDDLRFAAWPYTGTFFGIAGSPQERDACSNYVAAGVITGILTFVIPVLPVLFSITSALAMVAASLAVASMFLLYPIALLNDLVESSASSNSLAHGF